MNQVDKKLIEGPFNKAIKLWKEKYFDEAISILLDIAYAYPSFPAVFGVLGAVYRESGDLPNALKCFKKTTTLSPKSELASRGLFHCLFATGQKDKAFAEARRFLSLRHSDEYDRILNEINLGLVVLPTNFLKIADDISQN